MTDFVENSLSWVVSVVSMVGIMVALAWWCRLVFAEFFGGSRRKDQVEKPDD